MGKASRDKGARFERAVVGTFKTVYPDDLVRRSRQSEGALESDVVTPEFWVECGHGKVMNAQRKYDQAVRDCEKMGSPKIPISVVKKDRQSPVVCIGLYDFMDLLRGRGERGTTASEAREDPGPAGQGEQRSSCKAGSCDDAVAAVRRALALLEQRCAP